MARSALLLCVLGCGRVGYVESDSGPSLPDATLDASGLDAAALATDAWARDASSMLDDAEMATTPDAWAPDAWASDAWAPDAWAPDGSASDTGRYTCLADCSLTPLTRRAGECFNATEAADFDYVRTTAIRNGTTCASGSIVGFGMYMDGGCIRTDLYYCG